MGIITVFFLNLFAIFLDFMEVAENGDHEYKSQESQESDVEISERRRHITDGVLRLTLYI